MLTFRVNRHRRLLWLISIGALLLSLLGMAISWRNSAIGAPLRPGLDFTGGTQIQIERSCNPACAPLAVPAVEASLRQLALPAEPGAPSPSLAGVAIQLLDGGRSVVLRLPSLSPDQAQVVLASLEQALGDTVPGGLSVDTIGPTLGSQLLKASLVSLLVSFVGISLYISFRYDRIYALLTIAGYSVNDTVVIFDRIREKRVQLKELPVREQADEAVISTLTRSVYTSLTTLLPLIALIFFGGSTLFWFALALSFGILVGAWSSIAVAPTLLPLLSRH